MILTGNLDQYLNLIRGTQYRQKKIEDDIISANCEVIVIFWFMANLEQSGSQNPDALS